MSEFTLRPARTCDLAPASELCLRSKAHWGYDSEFIEACLEELTLREEDLASTQVMLAVVDHELIGVVQLGIGEKEAELEKLFIEPDWIGRGAGKALIEWARQAARAGGAQSMLVTADPHAMPFYRKVGFVEVGEEASGSIPGRKLTVCRSKL